MTRVPPLLALLAACAPDAPDRPKHEDTSTVSVPAGSPTGLTHATTVPPENVLLVIADDLGIDRVRSYYPGLTDLPQQPTLDALAADGVRFETAWASPLCSPTRAMLMTGRYTHQIGLGANVGRNGPDELSPGEVTLPEVLARAPDAPWTTGLMGKWHLCSQFTQGCVDHPNLSFQRFTGTLENLNGMSYDEYLEVTDGEWSVVLDYATTQVTDHALEFVAEASEPWMLTVSYHPPHGPFHTPPEDLVYSPIPADPTDAENHALMIESLDKELGRLLDGLDPEVRARTHVVLVGDNGTTRIGIQPPFDPNRGKNTPFEHGYRVPLIVTGPAVDRPGSTATAMAHVVDILPTVLELAGVEDDPAGGTRGGLSLVPWLADPDAPAQRTHLYGGMFHGVAPEDRTQNNWAIRDATHRLVHLDTDTGPLEALYELGPEPIVTEGTALPEPWTADQQAIRDELAAARDQLIAQTPYEELP